MSRETIGAKVEFEVPKMTKRELDMLALNPLTEGRLFLLLERKETES
jgi:hypothetical protein